MKKEYNIQEIITGCLQGNPIFQRALVDQYSGLLYVICYRYLGEETISQDALQESLTIIFQNLTKYSREKGSFKAWASTITIRYCLGRLAKKKSRIRTLIAVTSEPNISNLEKEMIASLTADQLMILVGGLSEPHRSVFNLSAIDGYTHKEISKELNMTEVNSRTLLRRARKMLQDKIISQNKNEAWVNMI